jgi:hypothetical protein
LTNPLHSSSDTLPVTSVELILRRFILCT